MSEVSGVPSFCRTCGYWTRLVGEEALNEPPRCPHCGPDSMPLKFVRHAERGELEVVDDV